MGFRRKKQASSPPRHEYDCSQWDAMIETWQVLSKLEMFEACQRFNGYGTAKISEGWQPAEFFKYTPTTSQDAYSYCVVEPDGSIHLNGTWPNHGRVELNDALRFMRARLVADGSLPRTWRILRVGHTWAFFEIDILSNEDGAIDEWLVRRTAA
jgi:hypothetical protein